MKYHILPNNDLYDHEETGFDCKCNPKLQKQTNGDWLIIHKSYDRRENKEKDAITKDIINQFPPLKVKGEKIWEKRKVKKWL